MGKWTGIALTVAAMTLPTSASAGPDCLCRAEGRFFNQGDLFCIRTSDGPRLVRCAMSQNVTTWDVVDDSCPTANLIPPTEKPARLARINLETAGGE